MAHPCFNCGSECYCHGDIDDCIVSKTPPRCLGCGCGVEYYDDFENEVNQFECCSECDLPDACEDFGCAIHQGIRETPLTY